MAKQLIIKNNTKLIDLFGTDHPVPTELDAYDTFPLLRPVMTDRGVRQLAIHNYFVTPIRGNRLLLIPKFSTTNFASIPFLARNLISQTDPVFLVPAIVHDHLISEWNPEFFRDGLTDDQLEEEIAAYYNSPLVYSFEQQRILTREEANIGWGESAIIFKELIHNYKGRTVRIKGNIAYLFLRIVGILRNRK